MGNRLAVFFGAALLLAFLGACGSKPKGSHVKGQLISISLPLNAYAAARMRGRAKAASEFFFPMLEIYNGSGVLVYRSHESIENARILRGLSPSIHSLRPQEDAPRLADILEAVPDFRDKEQEILRHGSPVVLSIVLENCQACSVQEDALDEVQRRLLQQSIDVLVIRVAQPSP